jgi:hypothetical protein
MPEQFSRDRKISRKLKVIFVSTQCRTHTYVNIIEAEAGFWMQGCRTQMLVLLKQWARSRRVCMIYIAEWLERLAVNAKVATVLGSVPASSDR